MHRFKVKLFIIIWLLIILQLLFIIGYRIYLGYTSMESAIEHNRAFLISFPEFAIINGYLFLKEERVKKVEVDHPDEKEVEAYTKDAKIDKSLPRISIVIAGLGLSKRSTLDCLELPNRITLGFSPYSANLLEWVEHAAYKDFDILLNLPMQPINYPIDDPGQYALLHNLSSSDNNSRLNAIIAKGARFYGFYSPIEESYTDSFENIEDMFETFATRKKIFLYSGIINKEILKLEADKMNINFLSVDTVIDRDLTYDNIIANFYKLENEAIRNGAAIGIMHPYTISIEALKDWMDGLDSRGIALMNISALRKK